MRALSYLSSFLTTVSVVHAIPTISAKGSKFFTSDGDQFFLKGIAYQLSSDDPLIDTAQCQRDAAMMAELGANSIRVYHVGEGDHNGCMSVFESHGIYLFLDLDTFNTRIHQTDPMWTPPQEKAFQAIMDEFQQYDNLAAFFIGNEVLTTPVNSEAAVFVKAAARDMKAYRDAKGYRDIPIGYSHADISQLRPNLQNYLACGDNSSESVDFFGLNAYEWCGHNTYDGSGYSTLTSQVVDYPVPIFLSETGCNKPEPRYFEDQAAVFGYNMTPYWSGAIIYEWIQEENRFGLITYGGPTDDEATASTVVIRSGTPTPITPDFSNLKSAWAAATPKSTAMSAYTPSNKPPACPAYTQGMWQVAGDVPLPTLGATYNAALQYLITAGTPPSGPAPTNEALFDGVFTITAAQTELAISVAESTVSPSVPSSAFQGGQGPSGTSSGQTPTSSKGAAGRFASSSGSEILVAMGVGLAGVCFAFVLWT